MCRRIEFTLGGLLLLLLFLLGFTALSIPLSLNPLWHGVKTQGVITGVGKAICSLKSTGQVFSVQFTDQTGQVHTSTISQCDYGGFNASPGSSVSIVYLPNDPSVIYPPDELMSHFQSGLTVSILLGIITLFLLPLWITKRIRKALLQRQVERAAADRWRAKEEPMAHPNGARQD
jgi:uncharacterized protein DUF3592